MYQAFQASGSFYEGHLLHQSKEAISHQKGWGRTNNVQRIVDGIHEQQRCSEDVLKQWKNLVETQYAMLALVGPGRGRRTVILKSMKTIGETSLLAVQQIVQSARA